MSVAREESSIAREGQTIARADLLPRVSVQSAYNFNSPLSNGPNPFSFVAANGVREYLTLIDASWQIDLSGRLRAGMALARALREVAEVDLDIARRDIHRAVAGAYFDLLLARRLVTFEQSALEAAREFERVSRARQARGESSMADVYKAVAQRTSFEQHVSQVRLDARLANQVLASYWTPDVDRELLLEDTFDTPPAPPAELLAPQAPAAVAAIADRPEFARFDALNRQFQAERSVAKAELRPQASLIFQYGLDANDLAVDQRGYAAYFNLDLPIFDWFRSRGAARQADYRRRQVEQRRTAAERGFSREYLAARARVLSWHERIPLARDEFDASNESLRLARLLYDSGEGPALDVVAAEEQLSQAGTAYYSAIAQYRKALIDYRVATGQ